MACSHEPDERKYGDVDDELLQLIKVACHTRAFRLRCRTCIPPLSVRLPYMHVRLRSSLVGRASGVLLGYN